MNEINELCSRHRLLLLAVLISLALKIVYLTHPEIVNRDGALYIAAARQFANGNVAAALAYYPMPFYPLLLVAVHFVVGDWVLAGNLLSAVPLLLAIAPLYAITTRLYGRRAAGWCVLLFAVLPVFNHATTSVMRDPMCLLCMLCALWALLVFYQDCRPRALGGFAVALVCALLMRVEALLLLVPAALAVAVYLLQRAQQPWPLKKLLLWCAAAALGGATLLGLVSVTTLGRITRLQEFAVWGRDLLNLTMFAGYRQLLELLRQVQEQTPGAHYHANLLEITRHYAPLIYVIGMVEMMLKALVPTSLLAPLARSWSGGSVVNGEKVPGRWIVKATWVLFFVMNIVFAIKMNFTTTRYLWLPIVLLLPWLGDGCARWSALLPQRRTLAGVVLALIMLTPLARSVAKVSWHEDTTLISATAWLDNYCHGKKLAIMLNDRRFTTYMRGDDCNLTIYPEAASFQTAISGSAASADLALVYYSIKHPVNLHAPGYSVLREFCGRKKAVLVLRRNQECAK